MLADVDRLQHSPDWFVQEVTIMDKVGVVHKHHLYGQSIVHIVQELIGNCQFKKFMRYAPERHWDSPEGGHPVLSETWMGRWWWRMQVSYRKLRLETGYLPRLRFFFQMAVLPLFP